MLHRIIDVTLRVPQFLQSVNKESGSWQINFNEALFIEVDDTQKVPLLAPSCFNHQKNLKTLLDLKKFVHGGDWIKCKD